MPEDGTGGRPPHGDGVDLSQLVFSGLTMGSIYALVALGYHIIYVATRVLNFAVGEQVAIAGLFALSLATGIPMLLAIPIAVVIGASFGVLYERVFLRPAYPHGEARAMIATLGIAIVIFQGKSLIWGVEPKPFPPFSGQPNESIPLLGADVEIQSFWVFAVLAGSLGALWFLYERTLWGKAMRAAAWNERVARLVGIDTGRMKAASMAIASALATLAGITVAPFILAGGVYGIAMGVKGFAGAIVGGLYSPVGVVVGGLLVGLFEAFVSGYISPGLRDPLVFSLLIVTLLVRPSGLLGHGEITKV